VVAAAIIVALVREFGVVSSVFFRFSEVGFVTQSHFFLGGEFFFLLLTSSQNLFLIVSISKFIHKLILL